MSGAVRASSGINSNAEDIWNLIDVPTQISSDRQPPCAHHNIRCRAIIFPT
jgi:hypothetical protein